MGAEIEIAMVLAVAFLWVVATFAILSGIDRLERKVRRRERRVERKRQRRAGFRHAAGNRQLMGRNRQAHPH